MKTMNIRRWTNYMLAACLLACATPFFSSCAEDDHMDEYLYNSNSPSQPSGDEITEALENIPGISDVTLQKSEILQSLKGYFFYVDQLIDHKNANRGTFKQRCFLKFEGYDKPVVLDTQGYNMKDSIDKKRYDDDIVKMLDANYLEIEHRYFGESLPEDKDNLDFTYLYTDQAAADLHHIVTLLQKHLFPRKNKWVSTGTSKSGITTALYAYYSDKNGWDDIDLYLPFCAPFIIGTAESCESFHVGNYLANICGSGYPAGSKEAIAYERLQKFPSAIINDKKLREACLRKFYMKQPDYYKELAETYQDSELEKAATAGVLQCFYTYLFGKFSYVPFSSWTHLVPNPVLPATASDLDYESVADFVYLSEDDVHNLLETTRGKLSDEALLKYRKEDPSMVYCIQAYRELGSYRFDFSHLDDGTWLTPELAQEVCDLMGINCEYSGRYYGQWDGGKLMTAVHQWAKQTTKPLIFVYSYNDPWTGGAITDEAADPSRHVWKVINKIGTHSPQFLDEKNCDKEASQTIQNAIKTVLGI